MDKDKKVVNNTQLALDDKLRIKVLSPGMLVFRRFIRSKLAITGSFILLFMFAFSFLGVYITPYGEKQVFHKFDYMITDYAFAEYRTNYVNIGINNVNVSSSVSSMINTYIMQFEEDQTERLITDYSNNAEYTLEKLGHSVYILNKRSYSDIANYSVTSSSFTFQDQSYNLNEFRTAVSDAINSDISNITYEGQDIKIIKVTSKSYAIKLINANEEALLATNLTFDSANLQPLAIGFRIEALKSLYTSDSFMFEGKEYFIEGNEVMFSIYFNENEDKILFANATHFIVRRFNGEDSLSIQYKETLQLIINEMLENNSNETSFSFSEDSQSNDVIYYVQRKNFNFTIRAEEYKYLIDIYSTPSKAHWLGTDSNGMDVLTRMMYGGRVSLMIGFIVIFLELLIGIILGGIAGYFGKWIDNLIMRLVDIFNCIPFLPIMIILGALFDKLQFDPFRRILWLMVLMGVLGWSGIARLVRGQILSLREQEFMIAAEATGLSARRRIFRHLIPNVMPQLIVNATMGLGSIILTESTLSFLGLGAKYPMATWGAMIYSVTDASSLIKYTYIWIPVGILISLTVIAFNFVGDGLRDAFDPKMKR